MSYYYGIQVQSYYFFCENREEYILTVCLLFASFELKTLIKQT